MRHLARALPPPVAVAMVVACAMALAAAAQGTASQNHLPAGRSAYLDNAKRTSRFVSFAFPELYASAFSRFDLLLFRLGIHRKGYEIS
jgi:hypothetical protein